MHSDDTTDLLDFSLSAMYAQPAAVAARIKSDRDFRAEHGERLIQAAAERQARREAKAAADRDVAMAQLDAAVVANIPPSGIVFGRLHAAVLIAGIRCTSEDVSASLRRLSVAGSVARDGRKWRRS